MALRILQIADKPTLDSVKQDSTEIKTLIGNSVDTQEKGTIFGKLDSISIGNQNIISAIGTASDEPIEETLFARLESLLENSNGSIDSLNATLEMLNKISGDLNNGFYTTTCDASTSPSDTTLLASNKIFYMADYTSDGVISLPYFAKWTAPSSGNVCLTFNMNCGNTDDGYTGSFRCAVFTTSTNKTTTEINDATYSVKGNNYNHGGIDQTINPFSVVAGTTYYFFMYGSNYVRCNALKVGFTTSKVSKMGVRKVQRGTIDVYRSTTVTLSGFSSLNKMLVLLNGSSAYEAPRNDVSYGLDYAISSLSPTSLTISSSASNHYGTCSYQVIEFY